MQPLWEASQVTSSGDLEPVDMANRRVYFESVWGHYVKATRGCGRAGLEWSGRHGAGAGGYGDSHWTDPSGSVIPDVCINLVQPETNFRFQAVTNAEGIFRLQSLQPGTYQITFEASGFKRLVQDNIVLQTGAVAPVDARSRSVRPVSRCR